MAEAEMSYGQIAYETFRGEDDPPFAECSEAERRRWASAALAVCVRAAGFLTGSHMPDVIDAAGGLRPAEPMGAVYGRALLAHEEQLRGG